MTYGERLKKVRKSLGISQQEMGKRLGIAVMIVSRLESNDTMLKAPILEKLDAQGVNVAWLLTGSGKMFKSAPAAPEQTCYSVPVMDISAAAGSGMLNDSELILGSAEIGLEFRKYWGENSVIIRIQGDSMSPTIPKNSWVLVHRATQLKSEGIFVFMHDNELRCKRIQKRASGEIVVISDNPLYETEIYPKESIQLGDMMVMGEVVGVMSRL